jgi:hypothetical protein
LCLRFKRLLSCELAALCLCARFLTCVRVAAVTLALACLSIPSLTLKVFIVINIVRGEAPSCGDSSQREHLL